MAKGKKALASPFVPPDEQPYSIPKNWCWVKLEFVCSGQITDGTHKTPKYCEKNEGVPFVSAKDVTSEYIDWSNVKYIEPM
jgi:type I restriction enzyme S subunit